MSPFAAPRLKASAIDFVRLYFSQRVHQSQASCVLDGFVPGKSDLAKKIHEFVASLSSRSTSRVACGRPNALKHRQLIATLWFLLSWFFFGPSLLMFIIGWHR